MFKQKYIKYKNKYLLLKNIYGGMESEPPVGIKLIPSEYTQIYPNRTNLTNYYLPCEITHITTHLYSTKFLKLNPSLKDNLIITEGLGGVGYNQDPYVQLLNPLTKKYYNICNTEILHKSYFYDSQKICLSDRCVYKSIDLTDLKQDKIFVKNQKIDLSYDYTLIEGNAETFYYMKNDFKDDDGCFIEGLVGGEKEQSKGGNFISGPKNSDGKIPIFYIEGASPRYLDILRSLTNCILVELKCSFKSSGFRHIDEVMCFMPYGINNFKVWFYDSFNNELKDAERMENLDKISFALFGKSYEEKTENFVFFKYDITIPSFFNRSWIEYEDECICLFPRLDEYFEKLKKTTDEEDKEIVNEQYVIDFDIENASTDQDLKLIETNKNLLEKRIQNNEKMKNEIIFFEKQIGELSSYFNGKKPKIHYVNIPKINEKKPEGGVHCMIKQKFKAL
jgi:hypothetical protein